MNEEKFNLEIRKFLKQVGITSQREIEKAVNAAIQSGRLKGEEALKASVTLRVAGIDLAVNIDGEIHLA